jgi:cysteinyl-tRNA synthetase
MLKIHNSLSRTVENFEPQNPSVVTMYMCGPTVYDYVHVGNLRSYTLADFLHRTLKFNGYEVRYIMNITDVGHLTSNEDEGDDKLESSAEKQGKSAAEVADFYIRDFFDVYEKMNFIKPAKFTRATEYIKQQVSLIATLEEKGYTYKTSDGVYFDTSKFEDYGQLSGMTMEDVKEGARVEINPEKKNPTDFALWKFSPEDKRRWQEWPSPWGTGFPGWHAECSAMAMEELGDTVDIHLGGEDLRMIHHQNEIAQSECATGKQYVKYWVHGGFLKMEEDKMGKSLGNMFTLANIEEKGFSAMDLRYFYMGSHYRNPLKFSWESLQNAQNALKKIYDIVEGYEESPKSEVDEKYMKSFKEALFDDMNMPEVLAVVWDMLKSDTAEDAKVATLLKMDEVLGLGISDHVGFEVPQNILDLARAREAYRKSGIWDKADMVRKDLKAKGYTVEDLPEGKFKIKRL